MKNSIINLFFFILIIISFNRNTFSQSDGWLTWPEGLGFSNQLEYSYNIDSKREILENWLNLDYSKGIFSSGLRLEVFQPNDPDPSISRGKNVFTGIPYKYIRADIGEYGENLEITAGNFYTLFGRGMVLKSYEDRNIRIDNNLFGVKVTGQYANFVLTGLSGQAANINNELKDILHAVDLEYRGLKFLKMGASFATNIPESENKSNTNMLAFRLSPTFWNFDIYAEYSLLQNEDINKENFSGNNDFIGDGFYGNLNFYLGSFSFSGEYKYYDNISFNSEDGTVQYNTPPSTRIEYTYQLPNRHPSPLNPDNEQGFQLSAAYGVDDYTYINVAYSQTETLPNSSYFQEQNNLNLEVQTQLKEFYFQGQRDWNDDLSSIVALSYNEELATNTKNITPILENRFYFGDVNTIKLIVEHQHSTNRTTDEKYFTDAISIEYLRSPSFNVSLVSELETREPEAGRTVRKLFGFIQFGYKISHHSDISLLIGSRQAGNICIGGVCRYEPEFKGVELKLLTRL